MQHRRIDSQKKANPEFEGYCCCGIGLVAMGVEPRLNSHLTDGK